MMNSGWWRQGRRTGAGHYGRACRSFFVSCARCQALPRPVPGTVALERRRWLMPGAVREAGTCQALLRRGGAQRNTEPR